MKVKVLVYCLSVLVGSSAFAAGDLICEAGGFSKTYLIVDQGIHVPRDVEEKTNVVVVNESGSSVFKLGKLDWLSKDESSETAQASLVNLKHSGQLVIEYTYSQAPDIPPKNCTRCIGSKFGSIAKWAAVLFLDGKTTEFTCESMAQ